LQKVSKNKDEILIIFKKSYLNFSLSYWLIISLQDAYLIENFDLETAHLIENFVND